MPRRAGDAAKPFGPRRARPHPPRHVYRRNNPRGLHHLVYEIVDNSIDEAMAGFCQEHLVKINADGSCTVADDGRGIPVGIHPTEKIPTVEVVFATLGAGGKFEHTEGSAYRHQRRPARRGRIGRQFPLRMARSRSQPRGAKSITWNSSAAKRPAI
jgi:hypothetical protein